MTTQAMAFSLGGGMYNGVSPKQFISDRHDSSTVIARRVLRSAWNTPYAIGTVNGKTRSVGPFRAVNNAGDFLSRPNYSCGGPNQVNITRTARKGRIGSIPQMCDITGIPPSTCNPKFVHDSSDYIRFKKQQAMNQNYNDLKNGGGKGDGPYEHVKFARGGK
jgi:hypothetical protein